MLSRRAWQGVPPDPMRVGSSRIPIIGAMAAAGAAICSRAATGPSREAPP
jgi:hypothetical protein